MLHVVRVVVFGIANANSISSFTLGGIVVANYHTMQNRKQVARPQNVHSTLSKLHQPTSACLHSSSTTAPQRGAGNVLISPSHTMLLGRNIMWMRGVTDTETGMLPGIPGSAMCVQRFDDSLSSAIRITYRISLRSSSLQEPRYPLLKAICFLCVVLLRLERHKQETSFRCFLYVQVG